MKPHPPHMGALYIGRHSPVWSHEHSHEQGLSLAHLTSLVGYPGSVPAWKPCIHTQFSLIWGDLPNTRYQAKDQEPTHTQLLGHGVILTPTSQSWTQVWLLTPRDPKCLQQRNHQLSWFLSERQTPALSSNTGTLEAPGPQALIRKL